MYNKRVLLLILVLAAAGGMCSLPGSAASPTTELHIIKYARDNSTILNEITVNYTWMKANLPVLGDGSTHYYSQGPTFNPANLWDDAEYLNILPDRDWGAVKGTDIRDICDLAGGMSAGERVKIRAGDGISKTFPYEYIYTPNPRQGPMGITWYRSGDGDVPDYSSGMRLVMFADAKTNTYGWNTSGWHVFGNADMRDCWAPAYWYNFTGMDPDYPSSGGVSLKWISDILIYSNEAPPDTLFDGTVTLVPDTQFTLVPSTNLSATYLVNTTTPLGALDSINKSAGIRVDVTDKSFGGKGILMVDNIGNYLFSKEDGLTHAWICRVNGVTLDDFGAPATDGLNLRSLVHGDQVNFYYGMKPVTPANATAVVKMTVALIPPAHPGRIGIYQDGSWYLDMNGDGVWDRGDRNNGFGAPGWTPVAGDWNNDNITEIGVYRNGAWYLDYDASGWWSAGDKNFGYGAPGWTPVVGDWNGDGYDKAGAYKDGAWYLDSDGSGTWNAGDRNFAFGGAGWTPVAGKWTSDGKSRIGIYKDGIYYIDYSGDYAYGAGDKTILYGTTGSIAITGDWNANGFTEVGTKTGNMWQLDYDGLGAVNASTRTYTFGSPAWEPVTGDWNADGTDKIGIYRDGAWYLDWNGNGVWDAGTDKNFAFGTTGWIPVIGKWS